jgi:hypothetical protein
MAMAVHVLLYLFYFILAIWMLPHIRFIKKTGLPPMAIRVMFTVKSIAAIIYGRVFEGSGSSAAKDDSWRLFYDSVDETRMLRNDPLHFFTTLFQNNYGHYGRFFKSEKSYWNDLKDTLLVKMEVVFNLFSLTNYYVDTLFYSFITFFGIIAFVQVMKWIFPNHPPVAGVLILCMPSFLFWSSGMYKDGLIFMLISLVLLSFLKIRFGNMSAANLVMLIISFLILLLIRSYVAIILFFFLCLIPAATLKVRKQWMLMSGMILGLILLFFYVDRIVPEISPSGLVIQRQATFRELEGRTSFDPPKITDNAGSFLLHLPEAAMNGFLFPTHMHAHPLFALAFQVEAVIYLLLFLYILAGFSRPVHAFTLFHVVILFSFATCMIIFYGYIVNNYGAMVRYRSIYLPLIMLPLLYLNRKKEVLLIDQKIFRR